MIYSFVLIGSPCLCGEAPFKRHRMFFKSMVNGTNKEVFDVIAINCNSRQDIPRMITDISVKYLGMSPNEENIKTAVWSSACRAVLMNNAYGLPITTELISMLASYNINVDAGNCIYIPLDGNTLSVMEHFIASKMMFN